eukprot:TRINITY_DN2067_c0_g1_i7.p1 TRINITY_DN2067_c0_g1~~TRINITY_DN2067_c0_g1_i7.p1  ORF type:complete len:221 (-),score=56.98 TRINITY_DN2067_c0_g1_i7:147-809(-)
MGKWIPDEIFYAMKAAKGGDGDGGKGGWGGDGGGGGKGWGGDGGGGGKGNWIPDEIFYAMKAAKGTGGGGGNWGGGKGGGDGGGGKGNWIPDEIFYALKAAKGGGKAGSNWGGHGVWNPMFQKQGGKGQNTGLRSFPSDQRVWIGGLPTIEGSDTDLNKRLKEHMASTGLTCQYAAVFKSGTGGAAFKTEAEAQTAIATLNGSVFEGVTIQVDVLTKGNK